MGLPSELSCEAGSFSCCLNPHRCFQSEFLRFYFPALEPWVARSVSLPVYSHTHVGPPRQPAPALLRVLSAWLPCSAPPTGLDECFFLNSLVVRLLYSSISGRSGYFLVLNVLLSFFWLCEEAKYIYLRLHLGQKSV